MINARYPSICSWCSYGCTLPADQLGPSVTWCSNNHFENPGENKWPDKKECGDFEMDKGVTSVDIKYWPFAWVAAKLDKLKIDQSIKELNKLIRNHDTTHTAYRIGICH